MPADDLFGCALQCFRECHTLLGVLEPDVGGEGQRGEALPAPGRFRHRPRHIGLQLRRKTDEPRRAEGVLGAMACHRQRSDDLRRQDIGTRRGDIALLDQVAFPHLPSPSQEPAPRQLPHVVVHALPGEPELGRQLRRRRRLASQRHDTRPQWVGQQRRRLPRVLDRRNVRLCRHRNQWLIGKIFLSISDIRDTVGPTFRSGVPLTSQVRRKSRS